MRDSGRLILLIAVLTCMANCGVNKHSYQADSVRRIDIPEIDYNDRIQIDRLNPLVMLMGVSGSVMNKLAMIGEAAEYQSAVPAMAVECRNFLYSRVVQGLRERGYDVHPVKMSYWEAVRQMRRSGQSPKLDALLHVKIEKIGYKSVDVPDDYVPYLIIHVELTDTETRRVLYADSFATGYKNSLMNMTMLKFDNDIHYFGIKQLIDDADNSKHALFAALDQVATHIGSDLDQGERAIAIH